MDEGVIILTSLQIITFGIEAILGLIYFFTIFFVRCFRVSYNIFTANICLACMVCATYFAVFVGMEQFDFQHLYIEDSCLMLIYFFMACPLQVPLAFTIFSLHRYCTVVHHTRRFFHSQRWLVICILSQWLAGLIIPTPYLFRTEEVRVFVRQRVIHLC